MLRVCMLNEQAKQLLHKRRIEAWRRKTAIEARKTVNALRADKLKSQGVEDTINLWRTSLQGRPRGGLHNRSAGDVNT